MKNIMQMRTITVGSRQGWQYELGALNGDYVTLSGAQRAVSVCNLHYG